MADITIDPNYLLSLVVKLRAVMGKEALDVPDVGSNPTDDDLPPDEFQDTACDLSREEAIEEIRGLSREQQAELVALMWLGRDEESPEDWPDLVKRAIERREVPTEIYLLDHPHLTDHWLEGMNRLGLGGLVDGVEMV